MSHKTNPSWNEIKPEKGHLVVQSGKTAETHRKESFTLDPCASQTSSRPMEE